MEESFISLQPTKETPKRRFSLFGSRNKRPAVPKLASTSVDYDNTNERKSRRISRWKSFFHFFVKSSNSNHESIPTLAPPPPESLIELKILNHVPSSGTTVDTKDTKLENIQVDEALAIAITLPPNVTGSGLNVSIELSARSRSNAQLSRSVSGLRITKLSDTCVMYSGDIRVPPKTTIWEVSRMPLYLIRPATSSMKKRIETIFKPLEQLPDTSDHKKLVEQINLKLNFVNTTADPNAIKEFFNTDELTYSFITCEMAKCGNTIKTEALVDQITQASPIPYGAAETLMVKEILNQVVSKISLTSSNDFIEDFHKELEVQKSLLLETTSSMLSQISEEEQELDGTFSIWTDSSSGYAKTTSVESDSRYHMQVPSNTPIFFDSKYNAFSLDQNYTLRTLRTREWIEKEEVRADIDKTLELLETAKNKLLCYLNQTDHFKNIDKQFFRPSEPDAEKAKKEKSVVTRGVTAVLEEEVLKESASFGSVPKCPSTISDKNQQVDIEELEIAETFSQTASMSALNPEIPENVPQETTEIDLHHIIETANERVFEKRYSSTSANKISYEVIEHDLDMMIKELLDESNAIKTSIMAHLSDVSKPEEQLEQERSAAIQEDVKWVLDMILTKVDQKVFLMKLQEAILLDCGLPSIQKVNPTYFCLIDDYLDVIPTPGRSTHSPFSWVNQGKYRHKTNRLSLSVKRSPVLSISKRTLAPEGLLNKLEQGASFIADLYKEIYARPLNLPNVGHHSNLSFGPTKQEETKIVSSQPLVRKSNKMLKLERPANETTSETIEEALEKVINPAKESPKICVSTKPTLQDCMRIVSWKSEWLKMLKSPFPYTNALKQCKFAEVMYQFAEMRKASDNPSKKGKSDKMEKTPKIPHAKQFISHETTQTNIQMDASSGPESEADLTFFSSEEMVGTKACTSGSGVVYDFAQQDNRNNQDTKFTLKESDDFMTSPESLQSSTAPNTEDEFADVSVIHEESEDTLGKSQFESTEQMVTMAYDFEPAQRVHQPVADVPRSYDYDSSGAEVAYMKAMNYLQKRMDSDRRFSLLNSSSSSSEGSRRSAYLNQPIPSGSRYANAIRTDSNFSVLTRSTNISDVNRLNCSDGSTLSSRSQCSSPHSNDYEADQDTFEVVEPRLRIEYASQQELNAPEEIARIEENVLRNEELNPQERKMTSKEWERERNRSMRFLLVSSDEESSTSASLASHPSELEIKLD